MPKALLHCIILLTFALSLFSCTSPHTNGKLSIATAANMQFAMPSIIEQFTTTTGIECDLIISSSGKLTAQIKEGAPYHVFISADMKYPEEIYRSGLSSNAPKVYAYGKLVLWTMDKDIDPNISILRDDTVQHIALANPKTAPYGAAAVEVLKLYRLYDSLAYKLVFGESIAQTNQFITTQAAEMGFTAKSVVLSPEMRDKGKWMELDQDSYKPIEQGIIVLQGNKAQVKEAMAFYDFIFSEAAQKILLNFGYSVDE